MSIEEKLKNYKPTGIKADYSLPIIITETVEYDLNAPAPKLDIWQFPV